MYSFPIANTNGSVWDRLGSMWLPFILGRPHVLRRSSPAMMAANCSIVKRSVWQQLGGYDERYAGGGEDMALGRSMLAAGLLVAREPLLTVFHSHGLNFVDSCRQAWHWLEVARPRPQPFVTKKVHARRPDLR